MTTLYSLLTFAFWGIADLFYKKGNSNKNDKYNDIKTGLFVGVVMGIHALIYMLVNEATVNLKEILMYLPVSLCYILSMVIGYKGLKYIELSISSPVQNTSGVITSILLLIFFKETLPVPAYIAFVLIFVSIFYLCMLERKEDSADRKFDFSLLKSKKVKMFAIALPILYCLIDGLGTFLDGIYLDKLELISEDSALLAYEFTFLIFALCTMVFLKHKREKVELPKEKEKIMAAIFETAGQFFYVFAMAENSTISASIVGSYCVLSMILSRIFLKEKLSLKKYIGLAVAIVGLIILCILDV